MRSLILLQIVIALISINPAWAQHSQHSESKIQLDHGKKWATDTALRKGMDEDKRGRSPFNMGNPPANGIFHPLIVQAYRF